MLVFPRLTTIESGLWADVWYHMDDMKELLLVYTTQPFYHRKFVVLTVIYEVRLVVSEGGLAWTAGAEAERGARSHVLSGHSTRKKTHVVS